MLDSAVGERFRFVHLDTTDRRGMDNIGRLDFGNVRLAFVHALRFLRLLRAASPALVYVPLAQNRLGFVRDVLFLAPARWSHVRVVVHVHGGGFRDFHDRTDGLTRTLIRWTLRGVDRAIVLGERLRPMLKGLVPEPRVSVVPNGIGDPYHGALGRRGSVRSADGECHVVYLGTLMAAKGFLDLLAAAALLKAQCPWVRYVLAGAFYRAEDRDRAHRYVANGLEELVVFTGLVEGEAKAELLKAADIFAFPTHYPLEGHPYVILEAMAAGLAIVTTARAAIPETIVDGETGLIVPERDPHALAAAIQRLAENPELRARLGAAARLRFLARYTVSSWAADMTTAFEDALARP
ncbi:MAG: glycosyltransferase family 4 protein [Longimicrobiales bacterium]